MKFRSIEFHIVELLLAIWSFIIGTLFLTGVEVSKTVGNLVPVLSLLYGLSFVFGGFFVFVGIFWWGKKLNIGWIFIRAGLFLSTSNWIAYAAMMYWAYPESIISYGNAVMFCLLNLTLYLVSMVREVRFRHLNESK